MVTRRTIAVAVALVMLGVGDVLVLASTASTASGVGAGNPSTVTVANPIRVRALDNISDGVLRTKVTYTGSTARAEASTGATIGLAAGFRFKLSTCLTYHRQGSAPVAQCTDRLVDTRTSRATIRTSAPVVRSARLPRPGGAGRARATWAYFAGYAQLSYLDGGNYRLIAHSWPDDGLRGAAVALAARHQAPPRQGALALPPNDEVAPDGSYSGAVNTGRPDSICRPEPSPADGSLQPGVTVRHPAYPRAPAYYEVGSPTGAFAGEQPLGVMLVIHGGGWYSTGPGATLSGRPAADRWRARGWTTVNVSYRACGQSLSDVLWFYDRTRSWVGRSGIVCASGASAGGHLALTLASRRKGVYCVVSDGGPTDLLRVQDQVAFNPGSGAVDQNNGGRVLHNIAAAAFGAENLAQVSPALLAPRYLKNTRVLQAFAADDPLVPFEQATELGNAMLAANADAYVDSVQLRPGPVSFVHAKVSRAALADLFAREERLVAPIAACRRTSPLPEVSGRWTRLPAPSSESAAAPRTASPGRR